MRIDAALLALVTPMMPPRPPVTADTGWPGSEGGAAPRPPCVDPGALTAACAAGIGTKSSLVMGSLYFFRRNRSWTRKSSVGGGVLAYLRPKSPIARVYC